jgi:hypothetical protein
MPSQYPVSDFVTVSAAGLILVQVANCQKFGAIDLPIRDHGIQTNGDHLLTKSTEQTDIVIVFFHWLNSTLAHGVTHEPNEGHTL